MREGERWGRVEGTLQVAGILNFSVRAISYFFFVEIPPLSIRKSAQAT